MEAQVEKRKPGLGPKRKPCLGRKKKKMGKIIGRGPKQSLKGGPRGCQKRGRQKNGGGKIENEPKSGHKIPKAKEKKYT